MKLTLKKINPFPVLLVLICLLLCFLNYTPDTWLSGWDTLHPEFNFGLNLKRLFFGVWHEEQGLGTLTGHSQIADLPRVLMLYLSSAVLPLNFLRYFYIFLCLVLGPLGVYFFLSKIIFFQNKSQSILSFFGGLFYLLNLGTLQHFYVPFEMFNCLYGFLPWLLLFSTQFLDKGRKKDLIVFGVLTILSAPMAYASALWFAYFGFFVLFCFSFYFFNKRKKSFLKRSFLLLALTVFLNLYWLLPNLYFTFTSANLVSEAKNNLMFSERAFALESKYANFKNVFLLKSFLFEWQKYHSGAFEPLLGKWIIHLRQNWVLFSGWFLAVFIFLGIGSIFKNKQKETKILLPGLLFILFFLLHDVPGIKEIFGFLRENLNIFKEGFRFPWTKFSIFAMFCFAVCFSLGLREVFSRLKKEKLIMFFSGIILTLMFVWARPAFRGDLISPLIRIQIPEEYFEMFSWANQSENKGKTVVLPIVGYEGWDYYRFGYEGAGFIWFGIDGGVIVRDFDRWHPSNENLYWELSKAIYSQNSQQLKEIINKYQISQIILDHNMINPAWPAGLNTDSVKDFLERAEFLHLKNTFGKLDIYTTGFNGGNNNVELKTDLININRYEWGNNDQAFSQNGRYASLSEKPFEVYYPFRSLFTGRKQEDLPVEIEDLGDQLVFKKRLDTNLKNYLIQLPENYEGKELVEIDPQTYETKYSVPTIDSDGVFLSVSFPKIGGLLSGQIEATKQALAAVNCNQLSKGEVNNQIRGKMVELYALNANNCSATFYLSNLSYQYGYLIQVEAKNISGKPLLFWLENLTNRKADMELYLSENEINYLIQPPMAPDGLGYGFHFDNISLGKDATVNQLGEINIYPIPYRFLTEIKFISPENLSSFDLPFLEENINNSQITVNRSNPSFYKIKIGEPVKNSSTLILSQSFHKGWIAIDLDNKHLIKNHFLVNNWSNGWEIESNVRNIVLFFWPQSLQYLGFGLYPIILFFWLWAKSRK